jgi:signal transduction histidine kinase
MRLLPRSLFGRLVLTFVGGVVLTMLVTMLVQWPEREAFTFRVSAVRPMQRVADMVKLMDQLPGERRADLRDLLARDGMGVELPAPVPALRGSEADSNAAVFRDMLNEALGQPRPMAVQVARAQLPPPAGESEPREGFAFDVSVELRGGEWARFNFRDARRNPRSPMRVYVSIAALMAAMIVLSFVAVRRVTRPLETLARAADQLGGDIHHPPLAETGPLEVQRAARAFNSMQERLSRYVRTRTAILAAMSHDLKTPITRLRLRAELLEQADLREKFVRDLSEMERMVGTTLDYMRGLDDREPLRSIDVASLVAALQADAEELGQHVQVEGRAKAPFLGKPEGLKRLLQNLVDNAIRYGGGKAVLVIEDSGAGLTLYVRDSGPGIPEAELERVFEPFFRLEASRNPGTGGTGLGLSIARNIAQSMGGEVSLRNRPEGGLEAKVVLPRARMVAAPEAAVSPAPRDQPGAPSAAL